jgi:hypothetical protein
MPSAVIDACCLIDLIASGHIDAILRASGHSWGLPTAVQGEVQFIRQVDPADPNKLIAAPADLTPLVSAGALDLCGPNDQKELDLFTQYASVFRSDGEAMCLALAEARGWVIATDDRKAIRIAQQAGLTVLSSPQLLKTWSNVAKPDPAIVVQSLRDIELFARFRPNPAMPECQWWLNHLAAP